MALADAPITSETGAATSGVFHTATTFSPAAGSMVLVRVVDLFSVAESSPATFTVADSHGNSYASAVQHQNSYMVAGGGIFYYVYGSAPGSTTLTVTSSDTTTALEVLVSPTVITGQAASPIGPNTIAYDNPGSLATLEQSLTTTAAGSRVYLAGGAGAGITLTAIANTSNVATYSGYNNGVTAIAAAATTTPGATTFGWTLSAATYGSNMVAVEVLASASTAHTASAALTVTAASSAARTHGATAAAALTVTASSSATGTHHGNNTASAALAVTVSSSAARIHGATAAGALAVTAASSSSATRGRHAQGALAVTAASSAAATHGTHHTAAAALTVTASSSAAAAVALGSLTIAIAASRGIDPFGNPYFPGVGVYGANGSYAGLQARSGIASLFFSPPAATQQTLSPQVTSSLENTGLADELQLLLLTSGKSGGDDGALQLFGESADATIPARAILEFGGTITATFTKTQITSAVPLVFDTWHPLSLQNGWAAAAGYAAPQYRGLASPPNTVEVIAVINGGSASNAQFATLPGGYTPGSVQGFAVGCNSASYSTDGRCDTSGNLTIANVAEPTSATWYVHALISLDA